MKTSLSSLYVGIASFGMTLVFLLSGAGGAEGSSAPSGAGGLHGGAADGAPGGGTYAGIGTVVVNENGGAGTGLPPTLLDNGAVVCHDADANGIPESGEGGLCIPFDSMAGDSVLVQDDALGLDVPFQVCIDNNGDGVCGGLGGGSDPGAGGDRCGDFIVFSHESHSGAFHNPLLVPVLGFFPGCDVGQFPGVIVIICGGAHETHTHTPTQGTIDTVTGGTGFGDFCGAPTAAKAYTIV